MKSILIMVISAIFVLVPVAAYAQTGGQETVNAPLSQPLVREGTLAVSLAQDLKVGNPSSEAEAESELSAVGILPRNGWIADYPVTPDIIGELQAAVGAAAENGKILLGEDAALKAFNAVLVEYKLDIASGGSVQTEEEAAPVYPDTTVINNYYYDEGPPVVTYYAPPPDYAYLYSWVPYPFWWSDLWFPGFFVLVDFDVEVHGHHEFHHEHGFHHEREFVSNHFRDPATGRLSRLDPAHRWRGGRAGIVAERGRAWSNPSARRGAAAIFNRSRSIVGSGRPAAPLFRNGRGAAAPAPNRTFGSRSFVSPGRSVSPAPLPAGRIRGSGGFRGGMYTEHAYGMVREYAPGAGGGHTQSFEGRAYSTPAHSFSAPTHSFTAPPSGGRAFGSFSGGFGGRGALEGGRGSFGGGRGFGGGRRR